MPIPDVMAKYKIWYVPEGGTVDDAVEIPGTAHISEVVREPLLDLARRYLEERDMGPGYIIVVQRDTGGLVGFEGFHGAVLV
jgi:hypothetical protein